MLTSRQLQLLQMITELYIKDAEPVASAFIVEQLKEKVSSATIRNEMAELEELGYISQPHTSSGRIPTEKAYCFYVNNFINKEKALSEKQSKILARVVKEEMDYRSKIKSLAKALAEITAMAVVVAFEENDNYYTGLANFFSQPEFTSRELVINISAVLDELDEVMSQLYQDNNDDIVILIGSNNPFSSDCGSIILNSQCGDSRVAMALVGPMRFDYQNNYLLMKEIANLLNNVN